MKLPAEARLRKDLAAHLEKAGEEPRAPALDLLVHHLHLLARWNSRHHLTAIEVWDEILDRHIGESLLPLRWIGQAGRLLDIGTGNGYPALPILACRPGLEATLVERSERKSLFLGAVLRGMGRSGVRILTCEAAARGEATSLATGAQVPGTIEFDHVISRATLAPARYLRIAASWARQGGGRVFLYAGSDAEADVKDRDAHGLVLVHREPLRARRDSSLFVLER